MGQAWSSPDKAVEECPLDTIRSVKELLRERVSGLSDGNSTVAGALERFASIYTERSFVCGNVGPAQAFFEEKGLLAKGQSTIAVTGRDAFMHLLKSLHQFKYVADNNFEAYTEDQQCEVYALSRTRAFVTSRFSLSRIAGKIDSQVLVRENEQSPWTVETLTFTINDFRGIERSVRNSLRDCKCFVLDNSLRESTVGQVRGHTIKDKEEIIKAVRKTGMEYIIVAAFNNEMRAEDVFLPALKTSHTDFSKFFAFSEIADTCKEGRFLFGEAHIPVGLQKMKQFGVPNVIFEIDLNRSDVHWDDFDDGGLDHTKGVLVFMLLWHRKVFGEKAMAFVNLRDFPLSMLARTELVLSVVKGIAELDKKIRPVGLLIEEPLGIYLPQELQMWSRRLRELMDGRCWKPLIPEPKTDERPDGLLLVHVHNNWGLADAGQLACLSGGANGIWCSVCEVGAAQGHACSAVTLANLARMGNKDVSRRYNTKELAVAARVVTKRTAGHSGHSRQVVYGPRAVDSVFDFPGIAGGSPFEFDTDADGVPDSFSLAEFLGVEDPPIRISELASPALIVHALEQSFGKHEDFNEANAEKMKVMILKHAREDRKEEYSSKLGLARLFASATDTFPQVMADAIKAAADADERDSLTAVMTKSGEDTFRAFAPSGTLDFHGWFSMIGKSYFSRADSNQTQAAFRALDLDENGQITWWEIKWMIQWACAQYPEEIKDFDDVINVVIQHIILPKLARSPLVNVGLSTEQSARDFSTKWLAAFKNKEFSKLGEDYSEDAVLHMDMGPAMVLFKAVFKLQGPSFVCRGRQHIMDFWHAIQRLTQELGAFQADDPCTVCIEDMGAVVLQSRFKSTCFNGWFHGRYMVQDREGAWKIRADHLEIDELGCQKKAMAVEDLRGLAADENSLVAGRELTDKNVRDSLFADVRAFKCNFNVKNHRGCAEAYGDVTVMRANIPAVAQLMKKTYSYADPVVLRDKTEIELFWNRMIQMGLENMEAYDDEIGNFPMSICVLSDNEALVRSKWRMNRVGGQIHCQHMVRDQSLKPWLVKSDFFAIYDMYERKRPRED